MHRAVIFFLLLALHSMANAQSGQFESQADQASFRHALTATLGERLKLSNPGDSSGLGDGSANDQFGNSVAISGDTALVGAYLDSNLRGDFAGAVYVFVRDVSGWTLQTKLMASDGSASDGLGYSVAISGNTALIGARFDDTEAGTDTGSAYVFVRENGVWIQQAKIAPADVTAAGYFGTSVALEENTALIGAELTEATGAAYVYTRSANAWVQQAKLLANDGASDDRFGVSVAISSNTAVVGASRDRTSAGLYAGSAYVFTRTRTQQWIQQAKLSANNAASFAQFGSAVAVFSDDILVGAPYANPDSRKNVGSAYGFVRNDGIWQQRAVLTPSDAPSYALFGNSLAIDGNTAVIGAYLESGVQGVEAGAAYVYTKSRESWIQQARITGASANRDRFGQSVAISADVIFAGVPLDDTIAGENAGSAVVFAREGNQWNMHSQLTAGKGATRDWFGYAIAVYGDTAIVGAHLDDTVAENAGAAYVFTRSNDNWQLQAKLTALDGSVADLFGISVALWQDTALIGASLDGTSSVNTGSAYVFARKNGRWQQQAKLIAPNAASHDSFGSAVALSQNTALIGAPNKNSFNNASVGAAYVFVKTGSVWSLQSQLGSDDARNLNFGWSVAIAGNIALVGAIGAGSATTSNAGAVSVFERTGSSWSSVVKLTADDAMSGALFGYAMSLSGDAVLIGAQRDDTASGIDSGSAYLFTKTGAIWTQRFKLTPTDTISNKYFGVSVALNGNQALIGAHCPENSEGGTPAAYLFTQRDLHWRQDAIYRPEPSALNSWFGWSVALLDGSAFVTAHRARSLLTGNPEVGSVALFETGFRDGFELRDDTPLLLQRN